MQTFGEITFIKPQNNTWTTDKRLKTTKKERKRLILFCLSFCNLFGAWKMILFGSCFRTLAVILFIKKKYWQILLFTKTGHEWVWELTLKVAEIVLISTDWLFVSWLTITSRHKDSSWVSLGTVPAAEIVVILTGCLWADEWILLVTVILVC